MHISCRFGDQCRECGKPVPALLCVLQLSGAQEIDQAKQFTEETTQ